MNEQENPVSFFRFEELRVYVKATDYAIWLYKSIMQLSNSHYNQLLNRFLESSQNIAMNIAEGSVKNKIQFVYHLKIAKENIRACVIFTEIATKLAVFNEEQETYSRSQLMELTKMVGRLASILKEASANNTHSENEEPPSFTDE